MKKSRKNTNLIAVIVGAALTAALKIMGIKSPIDEATIVTTLGMFAWWVFDRRVVDKKIREKKSSEIMLKWKDPGFWTPWVTLAIEIITHFTGSPIPMYIIPIAGSIVASIFNRKGPRAPK